MQIIFIPKLVGYEKRKRFMTQKKRHKYKKKDFLWYSGNKHVNSGNAPKADDEMKNHSKGLSHVYQSIADADTTCCVSASYVRKCKL